MSIKANEFGKMTKLIIYQNPKSAMQSGKKNTGKWLVIFAGNENYRFKEPLMGWISAKNTNSQLKYEFASKDLAINFAKKNNYQYEVKELAKPKIKAKSYAANFTKPAL